MKAKSRKFGPRLTVSLTGTDYDTLNALADKEEVSASWVIRRAIDEYLERHRDDTSPSLSQNLDKSRNVTAGHRPQNQ